MLLKHRPTFRPGFDNLDGRILLSASPLIPAQIRQAYAENFNFNVNGRSYTATGAGQTIAIIDRLDSIPTSNNDLATFDRTFGHSGTRPVSRVSTSKAPRTTSPPTGSWRRRWTSNGHTPSPRGRTSCWCRPRQ